MSIPKCDARASLQTLLCFCFLLALHLGVIQICSGQPVRDTVLVRGSVIDSASGEPVRHLAITLSSANGARTTTTLTDSNGAFRFHCFDTGFYRLSVTSLYYASNETSFQVEISTPGTLEIKPIYLHKMSGQLKTVTVVAARPLIKLQIDRIIYDVQVDPESKNKNLLDVLRKVPLISVDGENKIQVKGTSNYKVLIDGRPSSLVAHHPEDVFKSMPASLVDRIEVITQPPARYDAEGLGGIINIVTKRNVGQGYVGSVDATHGELYSALDGSFTAKFDKLSLSTYLGEFWERSPSSPFHNELTELADPKNSLMQDGTRSYHSSLKLISLSSNYAVDSLHLLSASLSLSAKTAHTNSNRVSQWRDAGDSLLQSYLLQSGERRTDKGVDVGFNYEHGFKRSKSQLLTFSYHFSNSPSDGLSTSSFSEKLNYEGSDLRQSDNEGIRENTYQVDFVYPAKKLNIEAGTKFIDRLNSSDYAGSMQTPAGDSYITDTSNINHFVYNQRIWGLYNSYTYTVKTWQVQAGLRLETTHSTANLRLSDPIPDQEYTNLIPSIALQKRINLSSFILGYTDRIQRPSIWQLNPFTDKSDPTFIFTGNPHLQPVINHNISLQYSWFKKGFLHVQTDYSFSNNSIQTVTLLKNDSVSQTNYYNIGRNKTLSTSISLNYPLTPKLTLTVNGSLSYVWIDWKTTDQHYANKGLQGNLYSYLFYTFPKSITAAVNGGFYSPRLILQGSSSSYAYYSFTLRKGIFKDKGSISVSATNPFSKYISSNSTVHTSGFDQEFGNRRYFRNFTIAFSYSFGKLNQQSLARTKRGIKNDDTQKTTNNETSTPQN